ncbi:hypothetical protein IC575_025713 [Cucumis melo]
MTTMREWRTCDIEFQLISFLNDLVQYYALYLFGIQIHGEAAAWRSDSHARLACEDNDLDSLRDTSSNGGIDNDLGKSF